MSDYAADASSQSLGNAPNWAWARNAGEGAGLGVAVDNEGNSFMAGVFDGKTIAKYDASGLLLWGHTAGDIGRGVVVDEAGNSYLLGDFSGITTLGNYTLSGGGMFISKYNSAGEVIWAQRVSSGDGNSIAVDESGNIYIVGSVGAGTTIGDTYFPTKSDFIAKYNNSGQAVWARSLRLQSTFYGYNNLVVDDAGNSYLVGGFSKTLTFANSVLTSKGETDAFVAKYDTSGNPVWIRQIGSPDYDYAKGVAIHKNDNIYITGSLGASSVDNNLGSGNFVIKYDASGGLLMSVNGLSTGDGIGTDSTGNFYLAGNTSGSTYGDSSPLLIVKYDPTGTLVYIQEAEGESDKDVYAFTVDKAGNSYATGEFTGTFGAAGEIAFDNVVLSSAPAAADAFFAKLGGVVSSQPDSDKVPSPEWEWAHKLDDGLGTSIAVDNEGNSYLAGYLGQYTVVKYNASGQMIWGKDASIGRVTAIDVDEAGNSYMLTGAALSKFDPMGQRVWVKSINTGSNRLVVDNQGNSYVSSDANLNRITKYDASGQEVWTANITGSANSITFANYKDNVAVDEAGNVYIVGMFVDTATFGSTTLTSNGGYDAFIVKLNANGQVDWAQKIIGSARADYAYSVTVDSEGNSFVVGRAFASGTLGNTEIIPSNFIAKFNASGQVIWGREISHIGVGIGLDKDRNIYIGGPYIEEFLDYEVDDYRQLAISRYDAQGQLEYIQKAGGTSTVSPTAFAVDNAGSSYITGQIYSNSSSTEEGYITFGDTTLTTGPVWEGVVDGFFAKLGSSESQSKPDPLTVSAGLDQTVYHGYQPAACATLTASTASGGTPGYTYSWSTGETGVSIQVCPDITTVYTLTVTDSEGRTFTDEVEVSVVDVSCGSNKVLLCYNPSGKAGKEKALCVPANAVETHLSKGATLGSCASDGNAVPDEDPILFSIQVYPNPVIDYLNLESEYLKYFSDFEAQIIIYDKFGKELSKRMLTIKNGILTIDVRNICLTSGLYYLKINSHLGSYTFKFVKN
ncbi:SBBP repeat-containing protein [Pontibacter silvestris]|uniref:SBBP repeat-containing protein n=1 Tax=Pontibacter silvestris TaxID=2305183 RepID=A0ABW4WTX3_9BACT|nr:SBBP repeat-containing protein [Pontibacter silvestris]MCC9137317.1 SBBP repeat-containing protein [Pontibacter silvestris]